MRSIIDFGIDIVSRTPLRCCGDLVSYTEFHGCTDIANGDVVSQRFGGTTGIISLSDRGIGTGGVHPDDPGRQDEGVVRYSK